MSGFMGGKAALKRNKFVVLSFFVPFLLMIFGFAWADFYPFGENQAAVIDLYHQYFPFLSELQNKLSSGESLLYTWNGGLGTNFLALLAYYAASPLYLFTVLIPDAYLMEAMTFLIAVKVGIAGTCMAIYLQGSYRRRGWGIPAFAALYALCSYVMGYYWCIMWLDVVAILPLCILGLNRLVRKGDFKLYTLSLAAMMLTNYYIGGMMCIFIFFYYPVLYFSQDRRLGAKGCLKLTGKAVGLSVLGIALSAVLLLPVFLSLQNTYYIDSAMPKEAVMYQPLLDVVTNVLPGIAPTVREGLPNIYCGMVTVMLFLFYMMCRRISLRKRLLNCGLLAFLLLSFNWNQLDFLWHGAHFPNQLPFRYSFVFSFIFITLAYEAFLHLSYLTPRMIGTMTAALAGMIIIVEKLYGDKLDSQFAYVALLLLFVYAGIFAIYKTGKIPSYLMGFLILVMVMAELLGSVVNGISAVGSTERAAYMAHRQDVLAMTEEIKEKDSDFYRMELLERTTLNDPMLYHYPGISQFSSTVNGKVSYLMEHLGLEGQDVRNRYNYTAATPLINAMFHVKYLMGKGNVIDGEEGFFELAGGKGVSSIYKNKYPLSVGYMVDHAVRHWNYKQNIPFDVQNDFAAKAAGVEQPLFLPAGSPEIQAVNARAGDYRHGEVSCSFIDAGASSTVTAEFEAAKEQELYVMAEAAGAEWITAQNSKGRVISLPADCGAAVHVGNYKKGETVKITIHYPPGKAQNFTVYAYAMDPVVWEQVYAQMSDELMKVTRYNDRLIEGTVEAKKDGCFLMTVPYEKGWSIEVDGQEVDAEPLADALIMVPLDKGVHKIKISYIPEGFFAGIFISLFALLLLCVLCRLRKGRFTAKTQNNFIKISEK